MPPSSIATRYLDTEGHQHIQYTCRSQRTGHSTRSDARPPDTPGGQTKPILGRLCFAEDFNKTCRHAYRRDSRRVIPSPIHTGASPWIIWIKAIAGGQPRIVELRIPGFSMSLAVWGVGNAGKDPKHINEGIAAPTTQSSHR